MNKIVTTFLFALCTLSGYAQNGYMVKGEIKGVKTGKAVLTVHEPEQIKFSDTVQITNGRFEFKGQVADAVHAGLFILPEGQPVVGMSVLLENAPITVALDYKDAAEQYGSRRFTKQQVTGGVNQRLSEKFRMISDSVSNQPKYAAYQKGLAAVMALQEREPQQFKAAYDQFKAENEALMERMQKESQDVAIKLITGRYRDTEYSGFLLNLLSRNLTLAEMEAIFNSFTPKVQNSYFAERAKEEIKNLKAVAPGQPAPDFTLTVFDGSKFTLSSLKGKYVVVDFWASWCGPCRAAVPELKELYAKYKDSGLELVGVTNDSREKDWKKAVTDDKTPWIHVIDEFPVKNRPAKVATLYAIPYLPSYYLIAPDGTIIGRLEKPELKEKLKEIFGK